MACPLCGEICRCTSQSAAVAGAVSHRARFLPDLEQRLETETSSILLGPEAPDCSEQQFIPSLDQPPLQSSRSRFVVDNNEGKEDSSASRGGESPASPDCEWDTPEAAPSKAFVPVKVPDPVLAVSGEPASGSGSNSETPFTGGTAETALGSRAWSPIDEPGWKDEVAARLSHYRARRKPRPPKYPSLRLKFDPTDKASDSGTRSKSALDITQTREAVAIAAAPLDSGIKEAEPTTEPFLFTPPSLASETGRIIEFPRSYYSPMLPPPSTGEELADPVLDRPRIVEVPETELPEPALGGIILEPEEQEPERRPGFEIPLASARKKHRLLASACDASIVLGACALFGYIFFKITGAFPPIATAGSMACILLILFWSAYQYLLLTYGGTTPGLRIAHLRLRQFDGSPVDRGLRRWRALASILSGLSLGLGYAWCFLDEDALCWHDRITCTYLEPLQS